jgi:8-amino-7-oxononanoate synthase
MGLPGTAVSPIVPIILKDEARALAASRDLESRGFLVSAIRPPTVPPGTARLRVTLSATHEESQVDALIAAIADVLGEVRP